MYDTSRDWFFAGVPRLDEAKGRSECSEVPQAASGVHVKGACGLGSARGSVGIPWTGSVRVLQPCHGREVGVKLFFPILTEGETPLSPLRGRLLPSVAQWGV